MELKILLVAGIFTSLWAAWEWFKMRHFVPVLIRALQHLDEQADSSFEWPMPIELAEARLKEVQQYQSRIWIFADAAEGEYWETRLAEIVQEYIDIVETGDLHSVTST